MKVYYINLDSARERRSFMEKSFGDEDLIRVKGKDGKKYSLNINDPKTGKPKWKDSCKKVFIESGLLHKDSNLSALDICCNLGHYTALEMFLLSNDRWAIILEDDVQKTFEGRFKDALRIPVDCEMYYLCSADHKDDKVKLNRNGQIIKSRTLMGYAISRSAASVMKGSIFPSIFLSDMQVPLLCFESMREMWRVPIEQAECFKAYAAHTNGLIEQNELSKKSCRYF